MHGIIWWILVGLIAGWLTGKVMRGSGFGAIGDIVIGILGAIAGGFLFSRLGWALLQHLRGVPRRGYPDLALPPGHRKSSLTQIHWQRQKSPGGSPGLFACCVIAEMFRLPALPQP
jgi:uncharacterized membrane protein YeaQ/YmgE (transglycosylase-associated protein family)